jgi:hypothetical protein
MISIQLNTECDSREEKLNKLEVYFNNISESSDISLLIRA